MPITGSGGAAEVDPVASLVTALNSATAATTTAGTAATAASSALSSRQVIAGTGLTGGGTLAADRTLAVDFASSGTSSATKAVRADDSRLSSASSASRGFAVPSGSLDVWKAARSNAANELVEIVVFGDSTTAGSCFDAPANSGGIYSWTQRLRSRILAAGYSDGGRGIVCANDAIGQNPDGITSYTRTGFAWGGNGNGPFGTNSFASNTASDVITFSGKGTAIRLLYSGVGTAGGFSYSVDGGAAANVEANYNGFHGDAILASGLAEGTHTLAITNLGGSLASAPGLIVAAAGATGTGTGTNMANNPTAYQYVVTGVYAGGETTASSALAITQPYSAGNRASLSFNISNNGAQSYNVYRRISGSGSYAQILSAVAPTGGAGATSGNTTVTDDGSYAPNTGVNPPASATIRNTANKDVQVAPVFLRATGISVSNWGVSGSTYGSFFGTSNASLGNYQAQLGMGVTPGVASAPAAVPYGWASPEASHPTYARCRLAISALGINNQQGAADQAAADAACSSVKNSIAIFVKMARAAGADPLIVIPHLSIASNSHLYQGQIQEAIQSAASSWGVPWVDFNEAIGPVATLIARGSPAVAVHATKWCYDAEADYLWDNVLSQ